MITISSEGASFIGRRLGLIDETMDEEVERLKKKIAGGSQRIELLDLRVVKMFIN